MQIAQLSRFVSIPLCVSFSCALTTAPSAAQSTERASVSSEELQGNQNSGAPHITPDGRFIAFGSYADNFVPNDVNKSADIFLRDRLTGITTCMSVSSGGVQASLDSFEASISADGRYVAFDCWDPNLVPTGLPGASNRTVYVRDRQLSKTILVSVSSQGIPGNNDNFAPSISADGRYIAFAGESPNLVAGDTNEATDVFLHDQVEHTTARISISSDGAQGNLSSRHPRISSDGRYIAFSSKAQNLVPNDSNGLDDIFVHDRLTAETTRVSISSSGEEANGYSQNPSITGDGRYIAFGSEASNLVYDDTNNAEDAFVHDRLTAQTTRVSVSFEGLEGNGWTQNVRISQHGGHVMFESTSTNLVGAPDANNNYDVFIRTMQTGKIIRVSNTMAGNPSSGQDPNLTADGRTVVFSSFSGSVVPLDTNNDLDVFAHGPLCEVADINCTGTVDVDDLLAVINAWGDCPGTLPGDCPADIAPESEFGGGNGIVDVDDLLAVINNWS